MPLILSRNVEGAPIGYSDAMQWYDEFGFLGVI